MTNLFEEWQTAGTTSQFGANTQAILASQSLFQFGNVGLVPSQEFLQALVIAATNNGTA